MKLEIKIDLNNEAFVDDMREEIEKCLSQVTGEKYGYSVYWHTWQNIKDSNGNTVGQWRIK